jgi:hypothetical protein
MQRAKHVTLTDTSGLAAGKKFGKFKPEAENRTRPFDVDEEKLKLISDLARIGFCDLTWTSELNPVSVTRRVQALGYTTADAERFSLFLVSQTEAIISEVRQYKGGSAWWSRTMLGHCLNFIAEACPERELVLFVDQFNYVGSKNSKMLTLRGDVGDYLGESMNGGRITVQGSAGACAGNGMVDGKMCIEGNTGRELGNRMEGGRIIVRGKAVFISDGT